jgi:hypothetical protein
MKLRRSTMTAKSWGDDDRDDRDRTWRATPG